MPTLHALVRAPRASVPRCGDWDGFLLPLARPKNDRFRRPLLRQTRDHPRQLERIMPDFSAVFIHKIRTDRRDTASCDNGGVALHRKSPAATILREQTVIYARGIQQAELNRPTGEILFNHAQMIRGRVASGFSGLRHEIRNKYLDGI